MDEDDPVNVKMKMYEAQAIIVEKEQELEAARREIERLRITNQQLNFRDAVAEIEQTFNAKFLEINQKFELKLSKLQHEIDEKTEENLLFKEEYNKTIARLDKNNKDLVAEIELKTKELMNIFGRLETACSELAALQSFINDNFTEIMCYEQEENINLAARMNIKNDELTGESKTKELFMKISSRLDNICLKLDLNSSVILLGGIHVDYTDLICMFDSKEKEWINSHFKLPDRLCQHGSLILNGEIYIFGGRNRNEIFKSTYKLGENGEWIQLADMNDMRNNIQRSSVVFEDEIWVFGGFDGTNRLKTVEKYNKQKNIWIKMPEMREARSGTAVSMINGNFYVSGGYYGDYLDTIEVYDSKKEKWEIFSQMPLALANHASIVDGTNLIIIGGKKSDKKPSNEVWKIDVMVPKKKWKKMPNLQQPRMDHGAVKLEDGLMVVGGAIERILTLTDSVEIFDGQRWKEGPKLPKIHGYFSLIPLNNKNEKIFLRRPCK